MLVVVLTDGTAIDRFQLWAGLFENKDLHVQLLIFWRVLVNHLTHVSQWPRPFAIAGARAAQAMALKQPSFRATGLQQSSSGEELVAAEDEGFHCKAAGCHILNLCIVYYNFVPLVSIRRQCWNLDLLFYDHDVAKVSLQAALLFLQSLISSIVSKLCIYKQSQDPRSDVIKRKLKRTSAAEELLAPWKL